MVSGIEYSSPDFARSGGFFVYLFAGLKKHSLAILLAAASLVSPVLAQTIRVIDAVSGSPLPGVLVNGLDRTSLTDDAGEVHLDTAPDTLVLSHVGYESLVSTAPHPNPISLRPVPIRLDTLDVTAPRPGSEDIHRNPAFVTVITRQQFAATPKSLPDVLAETAGVQVKSLGGLGAFSTISLRGSSAEQVEVYLDGILLNSAMGGGIDLSNLPLEQVEQIEVYRGSGAEGSGVGGSVHIRTRPSDRTVSHNTNASLGSFGTRSVSGTVRTELGGSDLVAIADFRTSNNDFTFLDDNGTEYNQNDDEHTSRLNNDTSQGSVFAKWQAELTEDQLLTLSESLFWKHHGIPGISNNQSREVRFNLFRSLTEAVHEANVASGRLSTHNALYFTNLSESFIDREGEVGTGRQDNDYRTITFGWKGRGRILLMNRHFVTLGAGIGRESFVPKAHIQSTSQLYDGRRWVLSANGALDLGLPGEIGVFVVSIEGRQLHSTFTGTNPFAFSPTAPDSQSTRNLLRLRSGIRVDLVSQLSLKANVGRSHRAASLFELFGDRGGVIGHSELEDETGITWDAGLRYGGGSGLIETVYFEHRYENLIQFVQTSQATSRPVNIGKSRVRGVEATARARIVPGLELSGSYTYQDAADRSEIPHLSGNTLPNRAPHVLFCRVDTHVRSTDFSYEYTFEDSSFLDRANRKPLSSRHIHNVRLSHTFASRVTAGFDIINITDSQVADVWGYPLPGRTLFVTLRSDFSQ